MDKHPLCLFQSTLYLFATRITARRTRENTSQTKNTDCTARSYTVYPICQTKMPSVSALKKCKQTPLMAETPTTRK